MNKLPETHKRKSGETPGMLFGPGFSNICLCYVLTFSALLSPVALLFAFLFAEPGETRFYAHYFYIRTTVALLVIGFCTGGLLIVLGVDLSSSIILGGLSILSLTAVLTFMRCVRGFLSAVRGKAPPRYTSYFF